MPVHRRHIPLQGVITPQPVVGGNEPDVIAPGHLDAFVVIAQMPEIRIIANMHDTGIAERARHLRSIVGRAIIHDQYFKVVVTLGKYGVGALSKQVRQLVAGHHKRNLWFCRP